MSFSRYPKYKDSGVEWLGEVPEHWEVRKMKSIAKMESGHTPDKKIPEYWEGGIIPWISLNDTGFLKDNDYISETAYSVTELGIVHSSARLLPPHAVVFSRDATIGRCAITTRPMAVSQHFIAWICSESIIPEFLLLRLRSMTRELDRLTTGATLKTIGMPDVRTLITPVPPLEEQRFIIDWVSEETAKIDELITEQRRLMELLKEKRRAVISHAVTKGLNPDAPMKSSGVDWLGDVPAHWEIEKIKHLALSIEQGWSPQCEGFPAETEAEWGVLKIGCVNGGTFNPAENKLLPQELKPVLALAISHNDLLISRANTRELVGSAAVAGRDYPNLMLCDKLYRVRFNLDFCSPQFICRYLGSTAVRGQIELEATGASASMVNIGQSAILELVIASPPIEEQRDIIAFLDCQMAKLDTLSAEAQRAINLLQERRTALISAAVTGQIDVRAAACSRR